VFTQGPLVHEPFAAWLGLSMVRDHDLEGYVQAKPPWLEVQKVYEAQTMNDDLMLDVVDSILQHLPALDEAGDYVTQNKLRVLWLPSVNPYRVLVRLRRRFLTRDAPGSAS